MASANPLQLFDVLTTTANGLVQLLESGSITILQIIQTYLAQIDAHNTKGAKCRAVISTPPRARLRESAILLDKERREGKLRGPLHGIPILLKDNIATGPLFGMPTTAGSSALMDSRPPGDSHVVDTLVDRGLIILGKANLTELMGLKGVGGWSAVGGMRESPYILAGYQVGDKPRGETARILGACPLNIQADCLQTPAGSSTGSAVGVACGFAPISLGTETSGSIVSPAAAAALYAVKLTPGTMDMKGIVEVTSCYDALGAFGKSALDVALACDAILDWKHQPSLVSCASSFKLEDISVRFVDIEKWRLPAHAQNQGPKYFEQTAREYQGAKDKLRRNGVKVVDVYITPPEECMVGDTSIVEMTNKIIRLQAKNGIERYLKTLEVSKVLTLEEIIEFNECHADIELDKDYCPNQDGLRRLVRESQRNEMATSLGWLDECKRWAAAEGIDKVVSEHGVDVVVCCSDSYFAGVSVAARYPMAAVPLGYVGSSGRLYGLQAIAPAHQEPKLVKFMAVWEQISTKRRVPDLDACAKERADR